MPPVILAIDHGMTSSKVVFDDLSGGVIARGSVAFGIRRQQPGWLKHDPVRISGPVRDAMADCLARSTPPAFSLKGE
jgi:sugar (pentulose or hexulose) kinase